MIVTATEWTNFFALRCNPDAQPEIRRAAELMREAMNASNPKHKGWSRSDEWNAGDLHLPFVEGPVEMQIRCSIARCARVSYLTHEGKRDVGADVALCDRLLAAGHMSPFEHVARPVGGRPGSASCVWSGNFRGWIQYRKTIPNEDTFRAG